MTDKQNDEKKKIKPQAIVIRGLDKSKEKEVKEVLPNYINVVAYGGDIWVFSSFYWILQNLKNKYNDKTVECVDSNGDAHQHALKIQTQLNWEKFKDIEKNKEVYSKNAESAVMLVIHSSPAASLTEDSTKDFVQKVARHYQDNEKHKLRFAINGYNVGWFKKFQKDKLIKDANDKQIENLKWILHRFNPNIRRRQNRRIMVVKLFVPYNKVDDVINDLKDNQPSIIVTFANPNLFREQRKQRQEKNKQKSKQNKQKGVRGAKRDKSNEPEKTENKKSFNFAMSKKAQSSKIVKINLRKFPDGTVDKLEPVLKEKLPKDVMIITDSNSIIFQCKNQDQVKKVRSQLKNVKVNGDSIL